MTTVRALAVPGLLLAGVVLMGGCFGGGNGGPGGARDQGLPPAPATATANDAYLPGMPSTPGAEVFTPVELVGSAPGELELRLPSGTVIPVMLARVNVFDCRHDCWTSVADGLEPLQASDRLCLLLVERDERMVPMKLWVNRERCS